MAPLAPHGVSLHPADVAPQPAEKCFVLAAGEGRDGWGQGVEQPVQLGAVPIYGDDYHDGAFLPHPIQELGRAGWAATCRDDADATMAISKGPVGGTRPRAGRLLSAWRERSRRSAWVTRPNPSSTARENQGQLASWLHAGAGESQRSI